MTDTPTAEHPDAIQVAFNRQRHACEVPEGVEDRVWFASSTCRACLIASIATAVNQPGLIMSVHEGDEVTVLPAAVAVLRRVRGVLDEYHPLRVRAEQALLPLVES